jgi:hypothetical protein
MSTMKEHLVGMHRRSAEHHKSLAGHFETLSKYMAKAGARDSKGTLDALAAEHWDMAEFHADCAERCTKAANDDMNKRTPWPEGLSAIPRVGQPPLRRSSIDPELSKIIGVDSADHDNEEMSLGRR